MWIFFSHKNDFFSPLILIANWMKRSKSWFGAIPFMFRELNLKTKVQWVRAAPGASVWIDWNSCRRLQKTQPRSCYFNIYCKTKECCLYIFCVFFDDLWIRTAGSVQAAMCESVRVWSYFSKSRSHTVIMLNQRRLNHKNKKKTSKGHWTKPQWPSLSKI